MAKRKLIPIVGSTGLIGAGRGKPKLFVTVTRLTTSGNAIMVTDDGVEVEARLLDLKLAWKKRREVL